MTKPFKPTPVVSDKQGKILDLLDLYDQTSGDYRKSRDGYFSIETTFNMWNGTVEYSVIHDGYVSEFFVECSSAEKAEEILAKEILKCIKNTADLDTQQDIIKLAESIVEEF